MNWYKRDVEEILYKLNTNAKDGLTEAEVPERLMSSGGNKLAEKKKPGIFVKFFRQFNDFMILILLGAAFLSFWVSFLKGESDFIDPIIILMIVTLNAILGLFQESKAEKALEALKKMSAPTAKVIRDGKLKIINAEKIVCGDLIVLETGDYVPADARVIKSLNLKVEESALTGESFPVEKTSETVLKDDLELGDRKNMVFMGSSISYGRGYGIVVETGMNTEMGKIASIIMQEEKDQTPLQKKLGETGKILGIGALTICFCIFLIGIIRRLPAFEMFMTSVSLAVAAIPEGLPAIVTIMLAIGVQRMASRNAIIRRLPAVETLGSANVICSDKTGTLTQNKMKVVEVSDGFSILGRTDDTKKYMLKLAGMCNDSVQEGAGPGKKISGDPTEAALVTAAAGLGIDKNELDVKLPRISEIPFESERKLMTTIHKAEDNYLVITKGAPEALLERCTHYYDRGSKKELTKELKNKICAMNNNMADKALRVLGVAYKELSVKPYRVESRAIEHSLVFVGLIGMIDPPREEVKEAVRICKKAGIKPVMITGDHYHTAKAIAVKIGIMEPGGLAVTGEQLTNMTDEELRREIYKYSVFARVSPEHKVRIVKAFKSHGAVVAMTGDGVNDAPALKAADIGCAMGIGGTDVAKGAADMILTDDNFATIVEAVKEGRGIYSNIRKSIHFLLSSNIGEIISILSSVIIGFQTPLLAIHLLWVNLVTDSLPAIALGVDPVDPDIMNRKPFKNEKNLFSKDVWLTIVLEGCMIGLLTLIAFGIGCALFDTGDSVAIGRTMAFATLSISQLVHAFNMRSERSILTIDLFSNVYLIGAFAAGFILQAGVIMIPPIAEIFKVVPLSALQWVIVMALCIMPIVIVEFEKIVSSPDMVLRTE